MSGAEYDWWAAEGRPEHLRPLQDAGDRMFDDAVLREAGIAIFGAGVDVERELLRLEVAAPNPAAARMLIERRYGVPVEIEVVASAEYAEASIAWDWWRERTDGVPALDVWVDARVDDRGLSVMLTESSVEIVVTLRGTIYQGAITADYRPAATHVRLTRPVDGRRVVDGTTGRPGPVKPPHEH